MVGFVLLIVLVPRYFDDFNQNIIVHIFLWEMSFFWFLIGSYLFIFSTIFIVSFVKYDNTSLMIRKCRRLVLIGRR